jgi:hypothetical protein
MVKPKRCEISVNRDDEAPDERQCGLRRNVAERYGKTRDRHGSDSA